jgi:2'-hydroxyisoflavone reductase
MTLARRTFLKQAAAAGAALALGPGLAGCQRRPDERNGGYRPEPAAHPLRVLILGGTAFLGPACVEAALVRGHTVTLFNRGRTNPHLFPDLEKLRGDRDGDLDALRGRTWDAVIDTSGYVPRHVDLSARLLAAAVDHYVFVSSISVYADFATVGMDETAPVGVLDDQATEQVTDATYGPLKARCEQAAEGAMPGRVGVMRPGLIVGPRDRSDRFTYWPVRIDRGGEFLAPGNPDDPVQLIDVRDLGEFIVHGLERRTTGTFNCISPADALSMGTLVDACGDVASSRGRATWCDADFLAAQGVAPWAELPCWMPPTGDTAGFARLSAARAVAAGLGMRPLADTAGATLAWWREQPAQRRERLRAGLASEREAALLRAWHDRR